MFAERFRSIIDENKISRYKIAKELDVSQSTVANWYHGDSEPKATQIVVLCKYLDVSAAYLLGITDEY